MANSLKEYAYNCYIRKPGYSLQEAATLFPLLYFNIRRYYEDFLTEDRVKELNRAVSQVRTVTSSFLAEVLQLEFETQRAIFERTQINDKTLDKDPYALRNRTSQEIEFDKHIINRYRALRDEFFVWGADVSYIDKAIKDQQLLLDIDQEVLRNLKTFDTDIDYINSFDRYLQYRS